MLMANLFPELSDDCMAPAPEGVANAIIDSLKLAEKIYLQK